MSTSTEEFGKTVNTGKLVNDIKYQGGINRLTGIGRYLGNTYQLQTVRGNRVSTHRQRQRFKYIKFK